MIKSLSSEGLPVLLWTVVTAPHANYAESSTSYNVQQSDEGL